jgi:tripartite-type tricarboxylate transporter receptor subunit TctC
VVVQNVPGGGSLLLANQLFNTLPKDGSHIGIISNSLPLEEAFGLPQAKFAANKFNWIGRLDDLTLILIAWHTSKVTSAADVFKSNFSIGVPGKGSTADSALSVIKLILRAQYQLITGYRSGLETKMAMERGEVDATASVQWSTLREVNKDWIDNGKVRILLQLGLEKQPGLEHVPLVAEFAPDQRSRELINLLMAPAGIGRAIVAPPDIPSARLIALRNAFDRMISDPEFLKEAKKQHLSINGRSGASLQQIVEGIAAIPRSRLDEAKALFESVSR